MARPSKADLVAGVYNVLGGQPILLPVAKGQKRPTDKNWQSVTWEDTQEAAYQARLGAGNIGVRLGSGSVLVDPEGGGRTYHLVSVDVDEDEAAKDFERLNPWAVDTLQTVGARGRNFWIWVDAAENYVPIEAASFVKLARAKVCPQTGAFLPESDRDQPWGEWRCGGGTGGAQTVIYGVHPNGGRYKRISEEAVGPACVRFSEIVWPEEIYIPWRLSKLDQLSEKFGRPWMETEKGRLILNPPFFAAKYNSEHVALYEAEEQSFYEYIEDRGLWAKQSIDAVKWQFVEDFGAMAKFCGAEQLNSIRTNAFIAAMADLLKGCIEKRGVFKPAAGVIHLKNGMIDLRRGKVRLSGFSEKFYSRNQVPVTWEPEAECPMFMKFLRQGLNEEDVDLLQRWLGGVLLGVNLAQRFLILRGTAGGGKSTLIDIVRAVIGEDNACPLRTEMLMERFEVGSFIGKTFLVGADVKSNFLNHPAAYVIKQLVGGDMISAEIKGGKFLQVKGIFNVAIISNSDLLVNLEGDAAAYRRRMLILRYDRPRVSNPDPHLKTKILASEASGVLRWMVEGAVRYLHECSPENGGDIRLSITQQERVDNILSASDSLRNFIRRGIVQVPGQNVTKHEIQTEYIDYCEARGWPPVSGKKFSIQLVEAMLEIHRRPERTDIARGAEQKNQRGFAGVAIVRVETPAYADDDSPANAQEEPF